MSSQITRFAKNTMKKARSLATEHYVLVAPPDIYPFSTPNLMSVESLRVRETEFGVDVVVVVDGMEHCYSYHGTYTVIWEVNPVGQKTDQSQNEAVKAVCPDCGLEMHGSYTCK